MGNSASGKSNCRECCVSGRKPLPMLASSAPVRKRTMDVFPLPVFPNNQNTGTGALFTISSCCRRNSSSDRVPGFIRDFNEFQDHI